MKLNFNHNKRFLITRHLPIVNGRVSRNYYNSGLEGNAVLLLPSVCVFLLKVRFRPPKCPFKALFGAFFERFINYINMFLWPDPHSQK